MSRLISVIVPVYNVEKYLQECIESILKQSYTNLEIILVDDGSTDGSGKICDFYENRDDRVRVIHKKNGGLSDARNCGLDVSNGEYIYFCDSDDFIDNNTIEDLAEIAVNEDSDCVFFNARAFSDENIKHDPEGYIRKKSYKTGKGCVIGFKQLVMDEFIPCAQLHFYKRAFLDEYSLRFKKGIIGEDELFSFYTYLYAKKVSYCNKACYHRRLRPGSIMTSKGQDKAKKKFDSYSQIAFEMKAAYDRHKADAECNRYCKEFLIRIEKSVLLSYRCLSLEHKKEYIDTYNKLKKDIIKNRGFGDLSLIIRLKCWHLGIAVSGVRKYIRMAIYG